MDDHMGSWKVRQIKTPVIYLTVDLIGYCILDIFPHHLQIDQLRHDCNDDDDQDTKNQQAFDQPVVDFPKNIHDGFFNDDYIAGQD
jgi:hypothetical protein